MQKKKNTPLERPRSKLSFIITDDYPDKVLEKSGEWKIIGTRGREILYSLYALGLDRKAYDTAERIKGALIERRSLLVYNEPELVLICKPHIGFAVSVS